MAFVDCALVLFVSLVRKSWKPFVLYCDEKEKSPFIMQDGIVPVLTSRFEDLSMTR